MQPIRRVVARVSIVPLALLLAVTAVAVSSVSILAASPAGAATALTGRRADPLADAAATALIAVGQEAGVEQAVASGVLDAGDPVVTAARAALGEARWTVAALAAPRAGVDPVALNAAWAATSQPRLVAVLAALSQVGVPYRAYKSIPGVGFDCSGLTLYAWSVAGVSLPHNSWAQIGLTKADPIEQAQPGDLVQYPGHVMLALGLGHAIVHAPHTGAVVEVQAWSRARRVGSPIG